ncbi:hypothetical protein [Aurantibacillus circumpalustris]|uniref:hypothetical protein n=1 Tax=Aurantibacillus circumpalustris TaxID=3036359 RepID=UPI00295AAA1B|nr:hypothetical protein [Aurantibacillus circumpalustris]
MRLKFSLLFFVLALGHISIAQTFPVNFTVTCLKPYCGGARPTPEMEKMAQTQQPYSEKTILLVNAKGKCKKLKTNADGIISCSLKVGDYKLYEAWRCCKKTPDGSSKKRYDKACLELEWTKEFASLTVSTSSNNFKVTNGIVEYCDSNIPCVLESFRAQPPE